jgi:hypothetical protein
MSIWIILSWVFVFILTGINVFAFLKLKQAGDQMMKMAFPGTKNMGEALSRMQSMAGNLNRGPAPKGRGAGAMDSQLKAAMDMLQQMQRNSGGKR